MQYFSLFQDDKSYDISHNQTVMSCDRTLGIDFLQTRIQYEENIALPLIRHKLFAISKVAVSRNYTR